jgi:3-phenylpropionate/trans-cinnamate dioxygenase ferredoxin subunit
MVDEQENSEDWTLVATVDQCPPDNLFGVQVGGLRIVLANVDGTIYALEDQCSHQDLPLSDGYLEDGQVECIHHGARFNVCSGAATALPAIKPVVTYSVDIRDGDVYVQVLG